MRHVAPFLVVLLLTGCGGGDHRPAATPGSAPAATAPAPPAIRRAHCRPGLANCAAATGRIIYLETVDPDGDGDLHIVVLGGGVTGPGISVFDIERELRPKGDPRVGDLASAAGPVYRGSYGQRQIQATELHIARR